MTCGCYFCGHNKTHPRTHGDWMEVTGRLTEAESLDPKHRVRRYACKTCGHTYETDAT